MNEQDKIENYRALGTYLFTFLHYVCIFLGGFTVEILFLEFLPKPLYLCLLTQVLAAVPLF